MKIKMIKYVEVPDGATHYTGDLDDACWWKRSVADTTQWFMYRGDGKQWFMYRGQKLYHIKEIPSDDVCEW